MFKSSDTLGNNLQCWMRPKHLTFKHKAYSQHKYVSLVVTSLSHYSWGLKLDHKLSENIQRAKWPKYSKIQILYSKSFQWIFISLLFVFFWKKRRAKIFEKIINFYFWRQKNPESFSEIKIWLNFFNLSPKAKFFNLKRTSFSTLGNEAMVCSGSLIVL